MACKPTAPLPRGRVRALGRRPESGRQAHRAVRAYAAAARRRHAGGRSRVPLRAGVLAPRVRDRGGGRLQRICVFRSGQRAGLLHYPRKQPPLPPCSGAERDARLRQARQTLLRHGDAAPHLPRRKPARLGKGTARANDRAGSPKEVKRRRRSGDNEQAHGRNVYNRQAQGLQAETTSRQRRYNGCSCSEQQLNVCEYGETGRRKGLKIRRVPLFLFVIH